eukprot:14355738-Alexandrium_andersonii.AAC.1
MLDFSEAVAWVKKVEKPDPLVLHPTTGDRAASAPAAVQLLASWWGDLFRHEEAPSPEHRWAQFQTFFGELVRPAEAARSGSLAAAPPELQPLT